MKAIILLSWLFAFFDLFFFVFAQALVTPYSLALGALAMYLMQMRRLNLIWKWPLLLLVGGLYSFDPLWVYMSFFPHVPMTGYYSDGSSVATVDVSDPDLRVPAARAVWYSVSVAISWAALLAIDRKPSA